MAEAIIGKITKPNEPQLIYDEEYRHPIVASNYVGSTGLLTNISGKPYMTEYYRQVMGASTEAHGFQPDSIETYQSYERIKGLILKIDGELTNNWDGEWNVIGQEGVARAIFDLGPVPHDVFIADIGDKRGGLFELNSEPRLRTIAMDKIYEFDIKLIAIVTKEIEENLNKKTVKELVYSKDSAVKGGNAVLTVGDYQANVELAKLETVLIQDYLSEFYYEGERTIVIPNDDDELVFDPYLAKFLSYTFTTRKTGLRDSIATLGITFGRSAVGTSKLNIWDMFLQLNFKHPERYNQKYYLFNAYHLRNTRYYGNVSFSKMNKVILTESHGASALAYREYGPILFDAIFQVGKQTDIPIEGVEGTPKSYFFSDDFYTGNSSDANEKFIFDFFRDQVVDKAALLKVINDYWSLSPIQRCYLGGIYVLAVRIALSTTYNYL